MPTRDEICWELCKRNLDTRRFIILGALTVVTTFGGWVLQKAIEKKEPIWRFQGLNDLPHDLALVLGCAIPWLLYFLILKNVDRAVLENFEALEGTTTLTAKDKALFRRSMNLKAKFLPFILGMAIYAAILLPEIIRQ